MLGVVVAVVAIVALRHPNGHSTAAGTAMRTVVQTVTATATPSAPAPTTTHASTPRTSASSAASSSSSSSPAVRRLPLIVLNNTTISGLAERASHQFEDGGWTVTRYDNYQNDILSTCAYYDPSVPGAKQAAQALQGQFPAIKRVKPKFDPMPDGPIVVILTPDFA